MTSPFYSHTLLYSTPPSSSLPIQVKSVQSALSYLKCPPECLQSQCNYRPFMAHFLKQSFAQTRLKETDNGKLQQFNYSRSLITNQGIVERGIRHIASNYYAPLGREMEIFCVCQTVYYLAVVQEQPLCQPITMTIAMTKW